MNSRFLQNLETILETQKLRFVRKNLKRNLKVRIERYRYRLENFNSMCFSGTRRTIYRKKNYFATIEVNWTRLRVKKLHGTTRINGNNDLLDPPSIRGNPEEEILKATVANTTRSATKLYNINTNGERNIREKYPLEFIEIPYFKFPAFRVSFGFSF